VSSYPWIKSEKNAKIKANFSSGFSKSAKVLSLFFSCSEGFSSRI